MFQRNIESRKRPTTRGEEDGQYVSPGTSDGIESVTLGVDLQSYIRCDREWHETCPQVSSLARMCIRQLLLPTGLHSCSDEHSALYQAFSTRFVTHKIAFGLLYEDMKHASISERVKQANLDPAAAAEVTTTTRRDCTAVFAFRGNA